MFTGLRRSASGAAAASVLFVLAGAAAQPATTDSPPFAVGEVLEYRVKLGALGGGHGTMRVEGPERIRGVQAWALSFDVRARVAVAVVEDRTRSWIDPRQMGSLRYTKAERTPLARHDESVEIYPSERRWVEADGARGTTSSATPLDELSFIYFIRTLDLTEGFSASFDRHFDQGRNPVTIRVLRREAVRVPAGTFDAWVVEMVVRDTRRYGGQGTLILHVTADAHRIPVRIQSSMPVVGSSVLSLESWSPGAP